MRAWTLLVTTVFPFVAIAACGGGASTPDPSSSQQSAEEQGAAAIAQPPPPACGGDGGAHDATVDVVVHPSCSSGGGANANGVCSPDRDFLASAQATCANEHRFLTSFTTDEKCGPGSSNSFTFTCCSR